MASVLFDPGREGFADGTINWSTGDIRAMLVKSAYAFSAAHKFLSDLGANDNGRSASLTTKTQASGILNAANTTLNAIAAVASGYIVVFQHTGTDATARLIAYIDTATGLPLTPAAGGAIAVNWDTGTNKIAKL